MAAVQAIDMYANAGPFVQRIHAALERTLQGPLPVLPLIGELPLPEINWGELINSGIGSLGKLGGSIINKTSSGLLWVLIFAVTYGFGGTAAVLGMSFHSAGYLIKVYAESFEEVDSGIIESFKIDLACKF